MKLRKLPQEFYSQPTLRVAKTILGKYFCRRLNDELLFGRIVEAEAYLHKIDPASHSFHGKTPRNEIMFAEGGKLYVYFTYGMHFCCNIVTEEEGKGCAVLLRAVEPLEGIETMKRNRKFEIGRDDIQNLTNGPAKLCQAFSIGRKENGIDLLGNEIFIAENVEESLQQPSIISSQRIGIRKGNGDEKQWRFYFRENRFVSKQGYVK